MVKVIVHTQVHPAVAADEARNLSMSQSKEAGGGTDKRNAYLVRSAVDECSKRSSRKVVLKSSESNLTQHCDLPAFELWTANSIAA